MAVAVEVWETEMREGGGRGAAAAAAAGCARPRLFTGCWRPLEWRGLFPIFGGGSGSGSGRWKPNYPNVPATAGRTLWFGEIAQTGEGTSWCVEGGAGAHRKCAVDVGFDSLDLLVTETTKCIL